MTSASKVGDLFTAAGEAFSKLAELTCLLQTPMNNDSLNNDNGGWSADDTELLKLAVKRFGDDLNVISEHIKDKTMCQIKSTFKKIQPSLSNVSKTQDEDSHPTNAEELTSGSRVSNISTNAGVSTDTRLPSMSSISPTEAVSSIPSSSSTLPLQTATMASSNTTTSICSSPSPFLHYPLLRKSADITLNMLNARDDSDDEDRIGLSVFNSV